MAKNKKYTVKLKRNRQKKTNYKKRLNILKSNKLRLVIRPKNKNMVIQIIKYDKKGDITLVFTHSKEIEKFGWKASKGNIPSSYLTGYLLGKKALEHKIKEAILDLGSHAPPPKSRIYAALKGVIDSGIAVPHSKDTLPDDDTVSGKKISDYAKALSASNPKNIFSNYTRQSLNAQEIQNHFAQIKAKISNYRSNKK